MSGNNREPYAFFQIERPIVSLSEAERFLGKVSLFAARYLGSIATGSLDELTFSVSDEASAAIAASTVHTVTTKSRLELYAATSLKAILLRRSQPRSLASRYNFGYAASRIQGKFRVPLDDTSSQYTQDPARTPILCSAVEELHTPGVGRELYLVPASNHIGNFVLEKQIMLAQDLLGSKRDTKRTLSADDPLASISSAFIPFAKLPDSINLDQKDELISSLQAKLPIRLELGRIWASNL